MRFLKNLVLALLIPAIAIAQPAVTSIVAPAPIIQGTTGKVGVYTQAAQRIELFTGIDSTAKGFYLDPSNGNLISVGGSGVGSLAAGTTALGNILFNADGLLLGINTVDGADNRYACFASGTACTRTRGAFVAINGNEVASVGGNIDISTGDGANDAVTIYKGATAIWSFGGAGSDILPGVAGSNAIGSASLPVNALTAGNGTINGQISYSAGNTSFVVGSTTNHEIEFRANGAKVFEMNPDGTFIGTGTSDIGWTRVNVDNKACNTTCTAPCVFGWDTAAAGVLLACTDATADSCLCAGAS